MRRRLGVLLAGVLVALFDTAVRAAEAPVPERVGYTVGLFTVPADGRNGRSLPTLAVGVSLLLAERLDAHPRLRYVGSPAMIERRSWDETLKRAASSGVTFVLQGELARGPQDTVRIGVRVFRATESQPVAESTAEAKRDDLPRAVMRTALDALASAAVTTDAGTAASATAPFGRDAYAFVLYSRGVAAFLGEDGHPASGERALPLLTRSLVIDPKVPETRRLSGLIHLDAGRPGHARALWSHAVELRPSYKAAWAHLADLDRTQGVAGAVASYQKVLALDGSDLGARRSLGELLADAGRLEEAQVELEHVVGLWPSDLRARRALTVVLAGRHAGEALARELEAIVALDPTDAQASLELGAAYVALERLDEAATTYETILKKTPKNAPVTKLLADVFRAKGDVAKAVPLYEKLRRLQPDDPRPLFALGELYVKNGDWPQAERMFTEAAQVPGMLGDAYGDLGALALRRGQLKEALFFLSRAAERRPLRATVHYNYGLALYRSHQDEEAARELGEAVRLKQHDVDAWFASGVVALRRHRLTEAEAAFLRASELAPEHAGARRNLALLRAVLGTGSETSSVLPAQGWGGAAGGGGGGPAASPR